MMINTDKDSIVMMQKPGHGLKMAGHYRSCDNMSYESDAWKMDDFKLFSGKISYKNGKPVGIQED